MFISLAASCVKTSISPKNYETLCITSSRQAEITEAQQITENEYTFLKEYKPDFDKAIEIPICQANDLNGNTYYCYDTSLLARDILYRISSFNDGSSAYGVIHKFDTPDSGIRIASTETDDQAVFLKRSDGSWNVYIQDWYRLCGNGMKQGPCDLFLVDVDHNGFDELIIRNTYIGSFGQINSTLDIYKENADEPITINGEVIDRMIAENIEITADNETGVFNIKVGETELKYQVDLNSVSSLAFNVQSFMPSSYSTFYIIDDCISVYMSISGGGAPSELFYICAEMQLSDGRLLLKNPSVEKYNSLLIPNQYAFEE